jgi:tRNA threonylcarbamoyl adenosine modification protein YeaZ
MLVLALDTSMAACAACLYDSATGKVLAAERQAMERGHAEALPVMVEQVMARAKTAFTDLARIAVTTGPGSFTGIRVGLSFANGLAQALEIPIAGLDSLSATHLGLAEAQPNQLVVNHAGNSGLYYFSSGANPTHIKMATIAELVAGLEPGSHAVAGTAADDVIAARPDITRLPGPDLPDVASLAAWAARQDRIQGLPQPLYLREADAKPQAPQFSLPVTRAGKASLERLAAIHGGAFVKPWGVDELEALLALPGTTALMVADKAFILYRLAADEAEILTLATAATARHKGLATALVKAATTRLRAEGAKSLFLEVATDNHPAQALYRKLGFKQAGRRRSYYERQEGPAVDADILRLALA